ncbi:MAG TPA: magnesium/cobalt transporter CorA [Nitriliruptorales bacterium]|nr:magnesium/cobalt transporter CorA [Nitriliruptorales bacterium]
MIVDCGVYEQGLRQPEVEDTSEAMRWAREHPGAFVWIGLLEPSGMEFGEVRRVFDLHPLAVEDAIHAHQRPKLERYGQSLFMVLKTARYADPTEVVDIGEIMCFVGERFIVTVRHGEASPLSEVRKQLEQDVDRMALGPGAVLHAVADRVVDHYAEVLRGLDTDIDEIEDEVFSPGRRGHVERIYRLKREVQAFRRAVRPLAEPTERLASESTIHVAPQLREYFRDVHDHVVRVSDHIGAQEDLLNSALNANLAQVNIQQNEDVRRISAWVAIAVAPTLIGTIYGMNFDYLPPSDWRWGFFAALGVMLVVAYGLYRAFRRTGWL